MEKIGLAYFCYSWVFSLVGMILIISAFSGARYVFARAVRFSFVVFFHASTIIGNRFIDSGLL